MNNRYGEEYKGDSPFVAKCRKLQSIYREEIGEKIVPYTDRYGNVHYYGNYIENGDIPKESGDGWKNFLTECAFKHAKDRVENKKEYETIEKDRLFFQPRPAYNSPWFSCWKSSLDGLRI